MQKTKPDNIEGNIIPYSNQASILGLKVCQSGYCHVINTTKIASLTLKIIQRFDSLRIPIKLRLVKRLCRARLLAVDHFSSVVRGGGHRHCLLTSGRGERLRGNNPSTIYSTHIIN